MKQYSINEKNLVLKVKKSPLFVRGIMFFFTFISIFLPLTGIIISIGMGKGLHIGYFISLFLFGLIGFYLLRISLWNTYGKETIELNTLTIEYEANYGWFKDGKKTIEYNNIVFSINQIGYEEDKKGVLVMGDENEKIESVVKMPIIQIEELIEKLKIVANILSN